MKTFIVNKVLVLMLIALVSGIASCSYSFTGASISPDVKTIAIAYLPNNALLVQPSLSRTLTQAIRDKFTNQSQLTLVGSNGDLNIEGEITGYTVEPIAITGNQQAAQQRLKITVNIRFSNKKDPNQDYESSFSRYRDYSSSQTLSSVESSLIEEINDELAQDIFNKSVANW
jgi:outer membrane lipopolysaccharide assembly protein LptE/RlpB